MEEGDCSSGKQKEGRLCVCCPCTRQWGKLQRQKSSSN